MFVVLISSKCDPRQRYWVERNTFIEAKQVADEYEKDNTYQTRIFKVEQVF